jgi:hypothetical protein
MNDPPTAFGYAAGDGGRRHVGVASLPPRDEARLLSGEGAHDLGGPAAAGKR